MGARNSTVNADEIKSVVGTLSHLIEVGDEHIPAIGLLAAELYDAGVQVEIEEDDDDNNVEDGYIASTHTLRINGIAVAEWERTAVCGYDLNGAGPDVWSCEPDIATDRGTPEAVEAILRVFGLQDTYPEAPEPPRASEKYTPSASGIYAVCWEDEHGVANVVDRYDDVDAAEAVAYEYDRRLRQNHRGDLLAGYCVRVLPVS